MTEQAEAQPMTPDWNYIANRLLRQMDTVQKFTKEAAVSAAESALSSANSACHAQQSEKYAEKCQASLEEGKIILRKQGQRSWAQLVIALLTCIGIMVSIAFFINSSNTALIEAYRDAADREVEAQNKNQDRLERELNNLKGILRQALGRQGDGV